MTASEFQNQAPTSEPERIVVIPREGQPTIIGILDHVDHEDDWVRLIFPLTYTIQNAGGERQQEAVVFSRPPWGVPPSGVFDGSEVLLMATVELENAYAQALRALRARPVSFAVQIQ